MKLQLGNLATPKLCLVLALLMLLLLFASAAPTWAQSGGGYDLTWSTVDGGGATFSTGGTYTLGGTIGQPDAGRLSGAPYTLNGGFWSEFCRLFLPLIKK